MKKISLFAFSGCRTKKKGDCAGYIATFCVTKAYPWGSALMKTLTSKGLIGCKGVGDPEFLKTAIKVMQPFLNRFVA